MLAPLRQLPWPYLSTLLVGCTCTTNTSSEQGTRTKSCQNVLLNIRFCGGNGPQTDKTLSHSPCKIKMYRLKVFDLCCVSCDDSREMEERGVGAESGTVIHQGGLLVSGAPLRR